MKYLVPLFLVNLLAACVSSPDAIFDEKYSDSEIAAMTAKHFDVLESDAKAALKPAFKKYGAPHIYIDGLMSSVDVEDSNHLYGSGHLKRKIKLKEHTFWRIDGENLSGHLEPVKTAHLVYETLRLDPLSGTLKYSETLTKRGQKFTVFERKVENKIVITVHKSEDLPKTKLDRVKFFSD